ncbi:hypothetical protein I0622_000562 [Staphylococcus pseudintermedius]|nr:hypothetical protein [Staphylococcus pseudintermedius]EGQ2674712.1 hypothetical protein [Staphylococcus pseudintermedius]EGQ2678527.1 hypothetical protein [Staphylococcus pseudintermedius]EGQ2691786.1 hypothetical protein [Staphylococcus pseudintermedius]EGQ2708173.1 hypothetical protein [Staphylococcus pseudintermedius]
MKRKVTDTPGRFAMALCEIVFVEKSITLMKTNKEGKSWQNKKSELD